MILNKQKKIIIIIFFSIIIVFLIACIIIIIILIILFFKYKNALIGSFFNYNTCIEKPFRCEYFNTNPIIPNYYPDEFSKQIGIFCAQQIYNLENLSKNNDLFIPTGLILIDKLYTKEVNAPLFGYIALDTINSTLYIIIRGTSTEEEWKYDFIVNQKYLQTQKFKKSFKKINWNCNDKTMIHFGFYEIFLQIQMKIEQNLLNNKNQYNRIIISGHSLGAAISSICATYITFNITDKPIFVYTFGKPRVGNIEYSQCVEKKFYNRFWRIENENDIVIQLPLSAMLNINDYNHPWIYQHEGKRIGFEYNYGSLQLNHSMNCYLHWFISN